MKRHFQKFPWLRRATNQSWDHWIWVPAVIELCTEAEHPAAFPWPPLCRWKLWINDWRNPECMVQKRFYAVNVNWHCLIHGLPIFGFSIHNHIHWADTCFWVMLGKFFFLSLIRTCRSEIVCSICTLLPWLCLIIVAVFGSLHVVCLLHALKYCSCVRMSLYMCVWSNQCPSRFVPFLSPIDVAFSIYSMLNYT